MLKKIYFASDFHLGRPALHSSEVRERHVVNWLDQVKSDAECIYLVGDIFDYWYEYRQVVPRGFNLFKAKLFQLKEESVRVEVFTGNHDMWIGDFFEKELAIPVHREPIVVEHQGRSIYIGHGDGLGPGDNGYKMLKKIFANRTCQWLFSRLHPNAAISLMKYFSALSNKKNKDKHPFEAFEKEWLVAYVEAEEAKAHHDYYVFGHRHIPLDYTLSTQRSRYLNLGEWMHQYTYAVLESGNLSHKQFLDHEVVIYNNVD